MPSGRWRFRLQCSALRTPDSEHTGWPTPTVMDTSQPKDPARLLERREALAEKYRNNGFGLTLAQMTAVAGWPTPSARDFRYPNRESFQARKGHKKGEQLANLVATGWSTPTARDHSRGVREAHPNATGHPLSQQVAGLGPDASTERPGLLNPEFCRWLMGLPAIWARSMPGFDDWQIWQALTAAHLSAHNPTESAPSPHTETPCS